MPTIDIIIRDKTASAVNPPCIVCGNSDYNVKFDFDDEWQAHNNKIGVFAYNRCGEWRSENVLFEGDTCPVPALHGVRSVWIGVTAGDVRTSTPADVPCRMGATDFSDTDEPPSADVWGQILAKLGELQTEIDEIKAGGGGAPPDWAQNDPDGEGYIKNRCGGYDDVQTRESELISFECPTNNHQTALYAVGLFLPSVGDIMSVTVEGDTKEYTVAEGTLNGESALWFGTQNPSSLTDADSFEAFFASDNWIGGFKVTDINNNDLILYMAYGSLSEIVGKTVGLKQRRLLVTPIKINRRYLDVDEPAIKITEKGALYSPSLTGYIGSLGEYAVNLSKGKGGATGKYSFASGNDTVAEGISASSFGSDTTASGNNSAAFGLSSNASGSCSAAFGHKTSVSGSYSAAFGYNTKAIGHMSAAFGRDTSATKSFQFVCGKFNDEKTDKNYLFVVGSGTENAKKNSFAVTSNGEIVIPDPTATNITYMKARFNSDGTITLIPLADETKSYTTECTANRVTAITAESTDTQYPTAKAVYDAIHPLPTSTAETWTTVAETTTTEVTSTIYLTFPACRKVRILIDKLGGVTSGQVQVILNAGQDPYTGEARAAIAKMSFSTSSKYIAGVVQVDADWCIGGMQYGYAAIGARADSAQKDLMQPPVSMMWANATAYTTAKKTYKETGITEVCIKGVSLPTDLGFDVGAHIIVEGVAK